jgi:EAL domain-containing protein (putative c-di-GMP-specific phosphodiesterase class I)
MDEKDKAEATLNHLRELGFKLALDDFGCGYSSISMLKTLPFGILKIDRAFVREAESVTVGPSTLSAIIDIGKSQRLIVIAEGVETAEQAVGLERLGCDLLQGFRFHRPMEAAAHFDLICRSRKEQQAAPRGKVEEGERVSWF